MIEIIDVARIFLWMFIGFVVGAASTLYYIVSSIIRRSKQEQELMEKEILPLLRKDFKGKEGIGVIKLTKNKKKKTDD